MNIQSLLEQFLGTPQMTSDATSKPGASGVGDMFNQISSRIPQGFAGGAATGGIIGLLIGSKGGRKLAKTVVTYGGAALLGGMAYKAIRNWQQGNTTAEAEPAKHQANTASQPVEPSESLPQSFQLTLVKAMIAAAKADGHIDAEEQRKIFDAIQKMQLSAEMKGLVFDLLQQDISVQDIASGIDDMTQKSELYLASYLVVDPDQMPERMHLVSLAEALDLPIGLTKQLEAEVKQVA